MVRSAGADAGAASDWEQLTAKAKSVTKAKARVVRPGCLFVSEVPVFGVKVSNSVVEIRVLDVVAPQKVQLSGSERPESGCLRTKVYLRHLDGRAAGNR